MTDKTPRSEWDRYELAVQLRKDIEAVKEVMRARQPTINALHQRYRDLHNESVRLEEQATDAWIEYDNLFKKSEENRKYVKKVNELLKCMDDS